MNPFSIQKNIFMSRSRNFYRQWPLYSKGRKLSHETHNNLCNPLVKMTDNTIFLERVRVWIDDRRPVMITERLQQSGDTLSLVFGTNTRRRWLHVLPRPPLLSLPFLLIRKNIGSIHCRRSIVMETCENISTRFTRPDDPILHHYVDSRPHMGSVCRVERKKRVTCVQILHVCQSPWLGFCELFFLAIH